MGEWSKSVGEKGEFIVKFIFENILNFNSPQENPSIDCVMGLKHKKANAKSNWSSHGIDGLMRYKSLVEDYSLDIGIISSKYVGGNYPSNPSALFKSHIKDLAQTIECFYNSKLNNKIKQSYNGVNKTEIFGILVPKLGMLLL